MYTAYRISLENKPKVFDSLGDGAWYYNFDIKEYQGTSYNHMDTESTPIEVTKYEVLQVMIYGTPTVTNCIEAVLKAYKDENEQSLYDAIMLGDNTSDQINDIIEEVKADFNLVPKISQLDKAKRDKIRELMVYDKSENINSFSINNEEVWLDKDTRVGLVNSITTEQNAGKTETTIWFGITSITITCEQALSMLGQIEVYASECFNTTATHKTNIYKLNNIDEVLNYDYSQNYPVKLSFMFGE